ncbi:hypothetical protein [Thalassospira sp. TSL5-1]|uniref:hypothetical protein n=1 Tax=Thalassospira sp. TSL5-1 TaxID=1544451 RepID=UPI0009390EF5|nr:hypothetical protein [Thalassospira sp. TSL5-1]OKH86368.1 hypothetical protein LF95_23310 [Thalassospira sp. TSL5-1]
MAKRNRSTQISASFHYLVKQRKSEPDAEDTGFTKQEFNKIVNHIKKIDPVDLNDLAEIEKVKRGENVPFISHEEIKENTHFGCFEGAYYGQEYRNSKVGRIDPESLNLRKFCYLVDYRRDGKILIGTQYTGNYGDYDGIKRCFQHLLRNNEYKITSRTFTSIRHEIGDGEPVELKVNIRRPNARAGGPTIFSSSAMISIKRADYGDDFGDDVKQTLAQIKGDKAARKGALAKLMNNGEILEIDDDDIQGCSLLMSHNGSKHTVYLLGDSKFATKFPLKATVDANGLPYQNQVRVEMLRVLNEIVTPGLRQ